MTDVRLVADHIGHAFGRTSLFRDVSFALTAGDVLLVRGPNGSGKSTLLRILTGFTDPLEGKVSVVLEKGEFGPRDLLHDVGLCTPEMRLYEELTGWENILFFSRLRGLDRSEDYLVERLDSFGLKMARHREVKVYSSGMKQRLKLLVATLHNPPILYLDEPGSNLDEDGMALVKGLVEMRSRNGIVVVASNDSREFSYGTKSVSLAP